MLLPLISLASAAPSADARELLCVAAGIHTNDVDHTHAAEEDFGVSATEGAIVKWVAISTGGKRFMHVWVGQMFESARVYRDLWFVDGDLVCVAGFNSTIQTIAAKSEENPDGIPPRFRTDHWVLDAKGATLRHAIRQAPKSSEASIDLKETLALAPKFLAAFK